jgi:hypothetical protein
MRDADVRAAILRELTEHFRDDPETRIVEEMGIWSGAVRIDIAVINGELHGYELKSERDTLDRLPYQAELYSQVFDRVVLVTGARHLEKARACIPDWWGIIAASRQDDGVALSFARKAHKNRLIDPFLVAKLLWRAEALAVLERFGIDRGIRSGTVDKMAERLAERLPLSDLAQEVRATLKAREGWLGQSIGNKR